MDSVLHFPIIYAAPSGSVRLDVRQRFLPDAQILGAYYEGERLGEFCRRGCQLHSRKWSCPPFALPFPDILASSGCQSAILLAFSAPLASYADISDGRAALRTAHESLAKLAETCARSIESEAEGYAFLIGSCSLCRTCSLATQEPCRQPDKMRYSGEAAGLNLHRVCQDLLGFTLQWYQDGRLPDYTSVVTVVLSKRPNPGSGFWEQFISASVPGNNRPA